MANEVVRRVRGGQAEVPRVARGCQPQDNNFIIGGITPARRGTVRVRGVGGSADIVSIRADGAAISSPAVSPGPWVRYGRIIIGIIISTLEILWGRRATAEL